MSFSEREKGQNIPIRNVILRRTYPSLPPSVLCPHILLLSIQVSFNEGRTIFPHLVSTTCLGLGGLPIDSSYAVRSRLNFYAYRAELMNIYPFMAI